MPDITITIETPDQAEVIALLDASDAYTAALYPAESIFMLDLDELLMPEVSFFVARQKGITSGCVALVKKADDWGEIKRMFVDQRARGLKLGKRLLTTLEHHALETGLKTVRLETGVHQPEAVALYHGAGYVDIPPFGDYHPDPVSIFMEKQL